LNPSDFLPLPGPGCAHPARSALTGTAAPPRLLLVEADEAVATALSRGLRRHGWTVLWASTAEVGLQLQAEWTPHAVLLASGLPDMAAGGLVARLAERGGCGILVLSGREDDDLGRALLKLGAHDVMSKPMRAKDIAARILAVQRRLGQPAPAPD
jgi:two-component system OmpR family response regulator